MQVNRAPEADFNLETSVALQLMPGGRSLSKLTTDTAESKCCKRFIQRDSVHIVHVEGRLHLFNDTLQGAAVPVVDCRVAIDGDAVRFTGPCHGADQATVPIQDRSASVERDCLDFHLVCFQYGRARVHA